MKVSKVEEYIKQTVSAIKTKLLIQELQVSINNASQPCAECRQLFNSDASIPLL